MIEHSRQTKVPHLYFQLIGKKKISKFKITVYDPLIMDVFDSWYKLFHVVFDLNLSKNFSSLEQLVERLCRKGRTLLLHNSSRMYTYSWSSKKCSNLTIWRCFIPLWINISDCNFSFALPLFRLSLVITLAA